MSCDLTLYSSDSSMPYLSSDEESPPPPAHLLSWESDDESYFVTRTTRAASGLSSIDTDESDYDNDDDSDNDTNRGIAVSNNLSMPSRGNNNNDNTIQVVAPANLPAGYRFVAQVDHAQGECLVQVPTRVRRGETFVARIVQRQDDASTRHRYLRDGHASPVGYWRDGLFDCFRFGIFHPVVCLACWCSPLLLAQVMARLGLNMWGRPAEAANAKTSSMDKLTKLQNLHDSDSSMPKRQNAPFTPLEMVVAILVLHFGVIETALSIVVMAQIHARNEGVIAAVPTWTYVLLGVRALCRTALIIYLVTVTTRTRQALRHRHEIPHQHCRAEDACLAAACLPCVTAQMARHTADYETYHAQCCSPTGLSPYAPTSV